LLKIRELFVFWHERPQHWAGAAPGPIRMQQT
jgi:hypothetical protein